MRTTTPYQCAPTTITTTTTVASVVSAASVVDAALGLLVDLQQKMQVVVMHSTTWKVVTMEDKLVVEKMQVSVAALVANAKKLALVYVGVKMAVNNLEVDVAKMVMLMLEDLEVEIATESVLLAWKVVLAAEILVDLKVKAALEMEALEVDR
jgi:hypothetical protein